MKASSFEMVYCVTTVVKLIPLKWSSIYNCRELNGELFSKHSFMYWVNLAQAEVVTAVSKIFTHIDSEVHLWVQLMCDTQKKN